MLVNLWTHTGAAHRYGHVVQHEVVVAVLVLLALRPPQNQDLTPDGHRQQVLGLLAVMGQAARVHAPRLEDVGGEAVVVVREPVES